VRRGERLLASGERILFTTREHGVVLLGPFARTALVLSLCSAAAELVAASPRLGLLRAPLLVAAAALVLRAFATLATALLRWQRRLLVVTDRKALLVSGGLVRRVSALPLAQLEDVEIVRGGGGRLLRYGGLVASVGGRRQLLFDLAHLPDPDLVLALLIDLADQRLERAAEAARQVREAVVGQSDARD
jgi:hypothetical protein